MGPLGPLPHTLDRYPAVPSELVYYTPPQAHFLDICCEKYLNRVLTDITIMLTSHGVLECVLSAPSYIH